jgi:AcrR family transcriptional regulator
MYYFPAMARDAARRNQILDAARSLASQQGYEAVTMRAISVRAGVAGATVYNYFASKDQLLYELVLEWATNTVEKLQSTAPAGATRAERTGAVLSAVIDTGLTDIELLRAARAAYSSPDTASLGLTEWQQIWEGFLAIAGTALTPEDSREEALLLGLVVSSCFSDIVSGRTSADGARRIVHAAARRIVRDA